jgi:hypothetical protein
MAHRPRLASMLLMLVASSVFVGATVLPGASAEDSPASSTPAGSPRVRVRLSIPCVANTPPPGALQEQEKLLATLGVVQQYIKPELGPSQGTRNVTEDRANPSSQFGSSGMGWVDGVTVVFVEAVGDVATLQKHADALTALVPRPERVVVCQTALSEARLREIVDSMWQSLGNGSEPRFYGATRAPDGRALIQLRSDGEELARQFSAKYGDDVVITLGHLLWPSKSYIGGVRPTECGVVPPNTGTTFTYKPAKQITLKSGSAQQVPIAVTNTKSASVELPKFKAYITKKGSRQVVATHAQQIFYTLELSWIAKRQTITTKPIIGTDSCEQTGYALRPGSYDLYLVDVFGTDAKGRAVSRPIPVRIT